MQGKRPCRRMPASGSMSARAARRCCVRRRATAACSVPAVRTSARRSKQTGRPVVRAEPGVHCLTADLGRSSPFVNRPLRVFEPQTDPRGTASSPPDRRRVPHAQCAPLTCLRAPCAVPFAPASVMPLRMPQWAASCGEMQAALRARSSLSSAFSSRILSATWPM